MYELIGNNYNLLLVITRFGIPLGVGEMTVQEVCAKYNVHCPTLVAVLNYISSPGTPVSTKLLATLSADALVQYLHNSHHYFIKYKLASLRKQLQEAIAGGPKELNELLMKFFDDYTQEVHKHMGYEEKTVFPYVHTLQEHRASKYHISTFSRRHDNIEGKISELKNILVKYYPDGTGYALTAFLHDLFAVEEDLTSHNNLENELFVPLIAYLEENQAAPELPN